MHYTTYHKKRKMQLPLRFPRATQSAVLQIEKSTVLLMNNISYRLENYPDCTYEEHQLNQDEADLQTEVVRRHS